MESIFLDRELNGAIFDNNFMRYCKKKIGKNDIVVPDNNIGANHCNLLTYNDATIRELMKQHQNYHEEAIEAEPWAASDVDSDTESGNQFLI